MGILGTVIGLAVLIAIVSALAPESFSDIDIDYETVKDVGHKILDTVNIWRV